MMSSHAELPADFIADIGYTSYFLMLLVLLILQDSMSSFSLLNGIYNEF